MLQMDYSLGPQIHYNPYHISIIRAHFKRHIADLFFEIRDEMCAALDAILDLKDDGYFICRSCNHVLMFYLQNGRLFRYLLPLKRSYVG